MGCLDNQKTQTEAVVQLGDQALLRYNSKLPVVIYAPQEVNISYRIWEAQKNSQKSTIMND